MGGFIDMYLDDLVLTATVHSAPKFSTTITAVSSGDEGRNRHWAHPLRAFTVAEGVRDQATFDAIYHHWLITGGPFLTWPFTDPFDWASVNLNAPSIGLGDADQDPPDISDTDQHLGVGDGLTRVFQLTKVYERPLVGGGTGSYTRPIYLPQLDSVLIGMSPGGGPYVAPGAVGPLHGGPYTYEISRPGGEVTFTPAPEANLDMRAGFYFDTMVRFDSDDAFSGIVQSYAVSGYAQVGFTETRNC